MPRATSGWSAERVLHVRLAEGAAGLAQVLGDCAQDGDLACGQPRREDEPVEAVVLGLTPPGARERVLEHLAHVVRLELGSLVVAEPEVVDPDRRPVGGLDLVRALVADPDAHVLEQRQHVREEDRLARADELEGEVVERRVERDVEAHPEIAVGIEPLDPLDVGHRLPGGEVLAVGAGERLAVALEERAGALLADLLGERVAEVVRPGARRFRQTRLDLGDVVLRNRTRLGVDDDVEAGQHRLGDTRAVVDARAAERRLEDLLNPLPVPGVEALARQVDETGEEAAERVAADEEAHAPALAEVEDAHRRLEELVRRDLEQLVARVRLEDVEERLVVVTPAEQTRPLHDALGLAPEHRDLPWARAVGGVRVEPEEAPLTGDLAVLVEALDADVVEVRGAVHGRPRVRLRQVEEGLLPREPPQPRAAAARS